jgi:PhzF family phenazine biosynthesis protein
MLRESGVMNRSNVLEVAAFTVAGRGGNRAGVVLDAAGISPHKRQELAKDAGFSETAFIEADATGTGVRLEFFTPVRQIEMCGHATVGAFSALRNRGRIAPGGYFFESALGRQSVEVTESTVGLWQRLLASRPLDAALNEAVAASLGVTSASVTSPLWVASTGSPFLLIEVTSAELLARLTPDFERIYGISEQLAVVGYYVYHRVGDEIEARMFAPRYGIPEESATGMAAGALALHLATAGSAGRCRIRQGHLMSPASPAQITAVVHVDGRVLVSGEAHEVQEPQEE